MAAVEGVEQQAAAAAGGPVVELTGRRASLWADAWRELRHNPLFMVSTLVIIVLTVMAIRPQLFTSFYPGDRDPRHCILERSKDDPTTENWFGFDLQGCDYYTQTVHGARVSMIIGVTVVAASLLVAVVLGSLAGFFGGILDTLITRMTDVWFAVPTVLGAIVILTALFEKRGILQVCVVLVVLGWPTMLRLMRSSVLEKREEDYVDAARALGASDFRIITKHILPNGIAPVMVYGTISVGIIIAAEATLSFLGVGLQLPAISWGLMINTAQARVRDFPHLLAFPALFLSITVFAFILLGDALRDALDPKLR